MIIISIIFKMKIEDYYVLFNPISGNGKAKILVKKLISDLEKQQITYKLNQSDYPGHAKKICKKLQNYKKIIIIGGDGTL